MNSLTRPMFYDERGLTQKTGERFWTRQQISHSFISIGLPAWDGSGNQGATWVSLTNLTPTVSNNILFDANQIEIFGRILRGRKYIRLDIKKQLNKQWRSDWKEIEGNNCNFEDSDTGVWEEIDKITLVTMLNTPQNYSSIEVLLQDCGVDSINFMNADYTNQFNADVIYARRGFIGTLYGKATEASTADTAIEAQQLQNTLTIYNGSKQENFNGQSSTFVQGLPESYGTLFQTFVPTGTTNNIWFTTPYGKQKYSLLAYGLIAFQKSVKDAQARDRVEVVKYVPFSFSLSEYLIQNRPYSSNQVDYTDYKDEIHKVQFNISGADFVVDGISFSKEELALGLYRRGNGSMEVYSAGPSYAVGYKYELVQLQVIVIAD